MRVTHYASTGYLGLAAILTLGCNDFNAPAAPMTGTLEINVFTSGASIDFDPDGYVIGVDTGPQRAVGVNTTETFPELPPGSHLVRLEGLSPNCSVRGTGKLSVDVTAGGKAVALFAVSCVPITGTIQVTVATTGFEAPDDYTAVVGTVARVPIPANSTVNITGVRAGQQQVTLAGVAGICVVEGANPQTVTVEFGATAKVAFAVRCVGVVAAPTAPTPPAVPPPPPPPPPSPPPVPALPPGTPANASIAGFVIDESDECIIGARVELIDGPRAGAVFVQTVCGFWDYGEDIGFSFHDLPVGIPVTVRATANGYKPAERRVIPTSTYSYSTMIVLRREQ